MLVDNGVKGDSRVQKSARSAAEAGWDVVLLGRAPGAKPVTWAEGDAQVRLLPMPQPRKLSQRARGWLKRRLSRLKSRAKAPTPAATPPAGQAATPAAPAKAPTPRPVGGARAAVQRTRRDARRGWDRLCLVVLSGVLGDRAWRRLDPQLWHFERVYGPVIDSLRPDLIHANDFRMLGVGARAAARARAAGRPVKLVWDAHEFLPGINPWMDNPRWHPAQIAHERMYASHADSVVTVSEGLAELLQQEHKLPRLPDVVLNAPDGDEAGATMEAPAELRELCGIGATAPVAVYSGAAAPQRGLGIMVEALPQLAGTHAVFVVPRPDAPYMQQLKTRARELGVAERVHVLPYVHHQQVVRFLSAADVGVIPIHHFPNHEIALITKFFEYSHARLPLVVSDVRMMAETTRSTGQGEVFRAEDLADYVRAISAVLADPQRYRAAYDKPGLLETWTWEAQARILDEVYTRLLPGHPARNSTTRSAARPSP
nr:glycosyltransferase family 4 protein [Catellatospora sichuanensis]